MTADSSKSRTFILCEKKHLQTKRNFGTVAVTWGSFSLWCRQGRALCERPFALHRQQPVSPLPIRGKFCAGPHACVVYVYNVTTALYCAVNNHFCVIRVPFVATFRLDRR